jgi:hypothetical protein
MNDERRLALEAIAYGDDQRISPSDRMKALEMLERVAPGGEMSPEQIALYRSVQELSGEALDDAVVGFYNPGYQPQPGEDGTPLPEFVEREAERRAKRRVRSLIRRWAKDRGEEREALPAPEPEVLDPEPSRELAAGRPRLALPAPRPEDLYYAPGVPVPPELLEEEPRDASRPGHPSARAL